MTDCGLYARKAFTSVNHTEADNNHQLRRRILVASDVDWKDKDESDSEQWGGVYHVLLIVDSAINDQEIQGEVHILPKNTAEGCNEWDRIIDEVEKINFAVDKQEDIADYFSKIKWSLDSYNHPQHWVVRFMIDDSGFVGLESDMKSKGLDNSGAFILARQSYYYIKHTFHKHQHHDASADSLTTIHSTPEDGKLIGAILLKDLKHSLVELKRATLDSDYEGLAHTKGIVSYAKSLAVASNAKELMPRDQMERELKFLDNLDTSLQVKAEAFNNSVQTAQGKGSIFYSTILLLFAMIAPITLVYRDEIIGRLSSEGDHGSAPPLVDLLVNVMGGRWEAIILFIILVGFAIRWRVWPSRRPFAPPPPMSRFRRIIDFTVDSTRKGAILWWFMMAFGLIIVLATGSWILFGKVLFILD